MSVCVPAMGSACVHYVYRPALLKFWKKRERPGRSSERGGVLFWPVTLSRHAYPILRVRGKPVQAARKAMKGQVLRFE